MVSQKGGPQSLGLNPFEGGEAGDDGFFGLVEGAGAQKKHQMACMSRLRDHHVFGTNPSLDPFAIARGGDAKSDKRVGVRQILGRALALNLRGNSLKTFMIEKNLEMWGTGHSSGNLLGMRK